MTVGRSEQANTLEVESDLKVRSTVGCVPSVTFLRSLSTPEGWKEKQGVQTCGQSRLERWE